MDKFNEWIQELKDKNDIKMYRHFDVKININKDADIERVRKSIQSLPSHQFLPFIRRVNTTTRYRRKKCNCSHSETNKSCAPDCQYRQREKIKKLRPIMYSSNLDSYIYSYCNYLIYDFYERKIRDNGIDSLITAYRKIPTQENPRKNKCNIHFAQEAFDEIKKHKNCIVITADITGFFDHLNHGLLKDNLKKILSVDKLGSSVYKILRSLTNYKYINYYPDFKNPKVRSLLKKKQNPSHIYLKLKEIVRRNKADFGIPQGSPISGLLSNIYMYEFDLSFRRNFPLVFYRRYCDDIIVVCQNTEATKIRDFLMTEIKKSKLEIEESKTNISYYLEKKFVKVTDGRNAIKKRNYVDYLGFEFYGRNTLMRKKSLGKLRDKQEKRVAKMVYNTEFKIKSKSNVLKKKRIKSNYLKKSSSLFNDKKLAKQIRTLSVRRNKIKKKTLSRKNS